MTESDRESQRAIEGDRGSQRVTEGHRGSPRVPAGPSGSSSDRQLVPAGPRELLPGPTELLPRKPAALRPGAAQLEGRVGSGGPSRLSPAEQPAQSSSEIKGLHMPYSNASSTHAKHFDKHFSMIRSD